MGAARKTLVLLGCLVTGLTSTSPSPVGAVATERSVQLGDEGTLRAELPNARFATRTSTGDVTFIGGSSADPLQASSDDDSSAIARRFVNRFGTDFGIEDPRADLVEASVFNSDVGDAVRFQQRYRGVPVLAGQIAVQIDPHGAVVSATGETATGFDIDVQSTVSGADAATMARALTVRNDSVSAAALTVSEPELWIYDPSLIGADDVIGPRLVWRVDVRTDAGDVDRLVLIDAHTGSVALHFNQRADAKVREVCDNANNAAIPLACTVVVRGEGQPPVGNPT